MTFQKIQKITSGEINYKTLSKYEKLEFIQFHGWGCPNARKELAMYLNALRTGESVDYFESFGKTPHHMIYNKRLLEKHKLKRLVLNSFGWINLVDKQGQLEIEF